jgi:aspartate kinase
MAKRVGTSARLFSALSGAKVNVRMIDQGSSEMNIIVGVENDDFNAAVNAIYKEFV